MLTREGGRYSAFHAVATINAKFHNLRLFASVHVATSLCAVTT